VSELIHINFDMYQFRGAVRGGQIRCRQPAARYGRLGDRRTRSSATLERVTLLGDAVAFAALPIEMRTLLDCQVTTRVSRSI